MALYCESPGCERPTELGRKFCPMHYKRWQRTGELGGADPTERPSPLERLQRAATTYADASAESDADYAAAELELRQAARAFAKAHPEEPAAPKAPRLEQLVLL